MKKKHRKILVRTLVTLIPAIILAGVLTYIKLFGFKRTLEELVRSRTHGQYSLIIDHSFVNPVSLSFTFYGLTIRRNAAVSSGGIREVSIPLMHLRFGSLKSLLMVKQFNIKSLTIDEPVIEFDTAPTRSAVANHETANLPQQLVKLYPAIEALLSNFNIESLAIKRASVGMEKKATGSSMRLNFIDLLIEHWNIQHLTEKSQLQLKVAGQHLEFAKVSLLFSGVEFNFQHHQLWFNDFKFYSLDSTSQSRIEATGKSLLLEGLDYKELYEHQRYAIRKAVIESPNVNLWINLNKKNPAPENDKDLFTRILRQSFGEGSIDSTIVSHARVHTVLHHNSDSVKIDLPQLDVKLHSFRLATDSTFKVGELEIDLNHTAISLRKNLALHCDRILFDKNNNLTLTDVMMYDSAHRKEVATLGKLSLKYFNLIRFIFDQRFYADKVSVENAVIQLNPETLQSNGTTGHSSKLENLDVNEIAFKNVTVNYTDDNNRIVIKGLSAAARHVRQNAHGEFSYDFRSLQFWNGTLHNKTQHLMANLKAVRFDGKNISANEVHVQKDSLLADATGWEAQLAGNAFRDKNYKQWNRVKFHELKISGWIPTHFTTRQVPAEDPFMLTLSSATVDRVSIQAAIDKSKVAFNGTDMAVNAFAYSAGKISYRSVYGRLENITVRTPGTNSNIESVQVDYPASLKFRNVFVVSGSLTVRLGFLGISGVSRGEDRMMCKGISAHHASIVRGQLLLNSDSIRLSGVRLGAKENIPVIEHLEVFRPSAVLPEKQFGHGRHDNEGELPLNFDWLNRFTIHPGALTLPNKKIIAFGKIEGDRGKNYLSCSSVSMETSKLHWRLYMLRFLQHRIDIDSISIKPNEAWLKNGLEESKISAGIYGLHFSGVSRDEIMSASVDDMDVSIDRFNVDVVRDKRLPEGPPNEKPATLARLVKLPRWIKINDVQLNRGRIHYTEISEKTGESGEVTLGEITAKATFRRNGTGPHSINLRASSRLYDDGLIDLTYETIDSSSFALAVGLKNMDLTKLNRAIIPLQALEIKSGYVKQYNLNIIADGEKAVGNAVISYRDLHLEIFKKDEPERRTFRSELITFVADGIILKNSKENATAVVDQPRIKHKAIFNYWIRSAMQDALGAIRKGKSKKTR